MPPLLLLHSFQFFLSQNLFFCHRMIYLFPFLKLSIDFHYYPFAILTTAFAFQPAVLLQQSNVELHAILCNVAQRICRLLSFRFWVALQIVKNPLLGSIERLLGSYLALLGSTFLLLGSRNQLFIHLLGSNLVLLGSVPDSSHELVACRRAYWQRPPIPQQSASGS